MRRSMPRRTRPNRLRRGSRGGRPAGFDKTIQRSRNEVERTVDRLKNFRAIATRFGKRAYVFQEARGAVGKQAGDGGDVRVGGVDGHPEADRDPGEGVSWRRRCTRAVSARWCGGSLHLRSPSRVTMSIATHSTRACGRSSAAGQGTNRAPAPMG